MEYLNEVLPIIIYLLLIVLIVVAIVIGFKFITTMGKVNDMVDDVNTKIKSLDKLFDLIDFTTNRVSLIGDTVVNFITSKLGKLFGLKKSKKVKEDIEDVK